MTISGTLTQNSDRRLKTVVDGLPDVSGIRAVRFRWNDAVISGIAVDINEEGNLIVEADRQFILNSGEVSLLSW